MRQFYKQGYSSFKFNKITARTKKATLFEIRPDILIWVPKSWIIRINAKSFVVKAHNSGNIKLSIQAEEKTLNK